MLTISYSSTDYIGHNFGVNSKETEDTYLRLDKELERLFKTLDTKVGKGEYTVFLTSDHGAVSVPLFLQSVKIPSGYVDSKVYRQKLNVFLFNTYKSIDLVENVSNNQIFLNHEKITELSLDLNQVKDEIVNEIINYEDIDRAYTSTTMNTISFSNGIEILLQNGFNQKRSGDVIVVYKPATISSGYGKKGTSHGSAFNYDTHVPLLFFGKGIKHGSTFTKTRIVDIAPTISALLGISFPNGATGKPLVEVLD